MRAEHKSNLLKVAEILGGTIVGEDCSFNNITTDSRVCDSDSLFIPVIGDNYDGHDFISELTGANRTACFLTSREVESNSVPHVVCNDTRKALGLLAKSHRDSFSLPVVGVTGTNGKTTTKELISTAFSAKYSVHKNRKNYNNDIGVPFTLFDLNSSHTAAVIEMGMNHAGEISYLTSLVSPDTAVITNADAGHLEFLGSIENVAHAKSEIYHSMKEGSPVFLNRDTQTYDILEKNAEERGLKVISYGIDRSAEIMPDDFTLTPTSVKMTFKGTFCEVPMYGIHNASNLLVTLALADFYSVPLQAASDKLAQFENVGLRGQVCEGEYIVINDSYNANPLSMRSALHSLALIYSSKRRIAVLADMKELGENARSFHHDLGKACVKYGVSKLFTIGEFAEDIAYGALTSGLVSGDIFVFDTKEALIAELKNILTTGDAVLIKGSRSMKMEEVAEAVECHE
jgi:UDP-N-acetylmuramoyl-tripeptide--D-alanyl-D-alanine ligase